MTVSRRHLAAAMAASGASVLAISSGALAPARAQTSDATAVAEAVAALTKAMLAPDKARLEALTADQLSYGHSSGKVEDKATFVDVVASKKTVYKSIELSNQTVVVAGNDAIVRHAWESESGTGDGKWNVSKIGVLQVWQKQASGWRLLARQAFKV
ncbi:MAG: nuclear transport factor 2 family protein [Alphaproteobacteria bacterium]|nr:nuclear transport factor 2 family protein [Alphaproteobacteria bacterium]